MSLSYLNDLMELNDRANILLISSTNGKSLQHNELNLGLENAWRLEDIGLNLERLGDHPDLLK